MKHQKDIAPSYEDLKSLFSLSQDMFCIAKGDGYYQWVNPVWEGFLGIPTEEILKHPYTDFIHPDDIEPSNHEVVKLNQGSKTINFLNRYLNKDKCYRWIQWHCTPRSDGRLYATGRDITESISQKESLERLSEERLALSQRLMNAHEVERKKIALDIHDELGQKLAALKIEALLEQKKLFPNDNTFLKDFLDILDNTINTVRELSNELRPPLLDNFGLKDAMEYHLENFEKTSNIAYQFTCKETVSKLLPQDISLALFRILQESLTNVLKHSRALSIKVDLHSTSENYVLQVEDNGIGIPDFSNKRLTSLGIIGMRERAASFGGRIEFSTPVSSSGTSLKAIIPIKSPL